MPANSVNRETIRDQFTSLLSAAMVGAGKPVQAVYGYRVGDFSKQSPVVTVSGASIERERRQFGNDWHTWVELFVHVFVAYADPASGWTEAHAEDRIDLIEKKLADVVMDNATLAGFWDELHFAGPSTEDDVEVVGGGAYRRAIYRIRARVLHG